MAFTTFTWKIIDKKYLSFANGKHQQEFISPLFEVDNIKFNLKCYPNGRKKAGLVNLYLTLSPSHFPPNIAKLKINYWLFCPETHSRMSDIRDFSNDDHNAFHGWATNTLNLKELENNTVHSITFNVGVNILKIYFKNEVAKGSDINTAKRIKQPLIYEKPFKMLPKSTFSWNINEFMFKSFLSAPNKKCWESKQFGQWVLGCYPNGHTKNDKGNAMLYLKCLGLPPSIYGVKIRYTLHCAQTNLKWSYVQHYNYANTNYANATFKTDTLHSLKSLNFDITILILKLYDLNRKEVPFSNVKKYLKMPSPSLVTIPLKGNSNNSDQKEANDVRNAEEYEGSEKGTLLPFDIYGTIQGIRDKLIGISNREVINIVSDDGISSVQEQVDIYSKELQAMNREIHLIRKGFKEIEDKQNKSTQSFQTVLKQVKMMKDEVSELKVKEDEIINVDHDKKDDEEEDRMQKVIKERDDLYNVRLDKIGNNMTQMNNDWSKDVNDLKQEITELKGEYNALNERLKVNDDQLVQHLTHLKDEIKKMKGEMIEKENHENEEIKKLKEENKVMNERINDFENDLKQLNEMMMQQKSQFEPLVNATNDDHKREDNDEDKERMKKMKEWVFSKLDRDFNKNDLHSIYNKLINDGFDDISLLSELNDDTLKSMGIHKRGDRIKILRACKTIQH